MNIYSKVASAIDKLAGELEAKGFVGLAGDMDVVANAMDNSGVMSSFMEEIKKQLLRNKMFDGASEESIMKGLDLMRTKITADQLFSTFRADSQGSEFMGSFDSKSAAGEGKDFFGDLIKLALVNAAKETGRNVKDFIDMLYSAGTPSSDEANVGDAGGPLDNKFAFDGSAVNIPNEIKNLLSQRFGGSAVDASNAGHLAKEFGHKLGPQHTFEFTMGLLKEMKGKPMDAAHLQDALDYLQKFIADKQIAVDNFGDKEAAGSAIDSAKAFLAAILMVSAPLSAAGVDANSAAKQVQQVVAEGSAFSSSHKPMVEDAKVIEEWVSKEMAVKGPAIQAYQNSGTWGRAAMKYVVQEQLEMTLRKLANDKKAIIASHTEEQIANAITSSTNKHVKLILWVLEDIYKEGNGAKFAAHYLVTRAIK